MGDKYQVMPPLSEEEYQALKADIAEHGVLVPVEIDKEGNTLDGAHRVRAWQELRTEGVVVPNYPTIIRVGLTEEQKRAHARRLNLVRRHLDQEQRRELIRQQLKETPEKSNRQIATMLGVSHPTVSVIRWELEESGQVVKFTTSEGADGKKYPRGECAIESWALEYEKLLQLSKEACEEARSMLERPDVTFPKLLKIRNAMAEIQIFWAGVRLHYERNLGRLLASR